MYSSYTLPFAMNGLSILGVKVRALADRSASVRVRRPVAKPSNRIRPERGISFFQNGTVTDCLSHSFFCCEAALLSLHVYTVRGIQVSCPPMFTNTEQDHLHELLSPHSLIQQHPVTRYSKVTQLHRYTRNICLQYSHNRMWA